MAMCDYRLCDRCGSKAFYDASLDYEDGFDNLGCWSVLCTDCSENYTTIIVPIVGEEKTK